MKYMGIVDSEELNKEHEKSLKEMAKMSIKINEMHNRQLQFEEINNIENRYIKLALDKSYTKLDNNNNGRFVVRPYNFINCNNISINNEFNYANKQYILKRKKLRYENIVPEDLILEAVEDKEYLEIKDNSIFNIINENEVWYRKIKASTGVTEVYTTLYITIPYSINPTDEVNFIEFDLYPYNSTEVISVEYATDYNNKYFTSIDALKHHKGCIQSEYSLSNDNLKNHIALNFETVNAKKIAITLRQTESLNIDGENIFYLGLSNLNIEHREYLDKESSFEFIFKPTSPEGNLIKDLRIEYNNEFEVTPEISIYEKSNDNLNLIYGEFIPFATSHKEILFKITFNKFDHNININKVTLYYE